MPAEIEMSYDQYREQLQNKLPNVDPFLVLKILYYERKFPDVDPKVDLTIEFNDDVNMRGRAYQIQNMFGLSDAIHKNQIIASGRLSIQGLVKLASNKHVKHIEGNVTPASY